MHKVHSRSVLCCTILAALALQAPAIAATHDTDQPIIEKSPTSQALLNLPRKPLSERTAVTIYEFGSGAGAISAQAATEMFTNALISSGQFRVVERARLNETVVREKQLNGAGQTTGNIAQKQLRGAQYIFDGTISEANVSENQHSGGISIGGFNIGGGRNKAKIAVDVRILDAETGDVLDSIAVSKELKGSSASVGGTAALAGTLASMSGKSVNPLVPDMDLASAHNDGSDAALRSCIETAVLELIKRVQTTETAKK